MDRETEFGGWASLAARRRAEDEMLVQRYARGNGRGLDMRPVRAFVSHVRRDLGPKAVICDVKMTGGRSGHEVVVGYYFPGDENETPAATPLESNVTDIRMRPGEVVPRIPAESSNGVAPLARSSARGCGVAAGPS